MVGERPEGLRDSGAPPVSRDSEAPLGVLGRRAMAALGPARRHSRSSVMGGIAFPPNGLARRLAPADT